ncbi:unnamed protein product [Pleuronectes platessa]|uniref:MIT domain-containing protein n=1 Tax=Pleuronectes platessa TaxID=8262 RepID=A0A9N7YNT7_PLEPL|nr:unnamed protein product [Pleuronectes platessa]
MDRTNLQKAIATAQKASVEDEAGNYAEAILSYQHAVKYFLHILKREPQGKDGKPEDQRSVQTVPGQSGRTAEVPRE